MEGNTEGKKACLNEYETRTARTVVADNSTPAGDSYWITAW